MDRNNEMFKNNFQEKSLVVYPYLEKDEENFAGTLVRMPERNEVPIEINEILIVEFYSK